LYVHQDGTVTTKESEYKFTLLSPFRET